VPNLFLKLKSGTEEFVAWNIFDKLLLYDFFSLLSTVAYGFLCDIVSLWKEKSIMRSKGRAEIDRLMWW